MRSCVSPDDYEAVLDKLKNDGLAIEDRRRLAAKAYAHTASYDTAITNYLSASLGDDVLGERFLYSGTLSERLRYGENPHQDAAFYVDQQAAPRARSRPPGSCRARRCRTTTLPTAMQRWNA